MIFIYISILIPSLSRAASNIRILTSFISADGGLRARREWLAGHAYLAALLEPSTHPTTVLARSLGKGSLLEMLFALLVFFCARSFYFLFLFIIPFLFLLFFLLFLFYKIVLPILLSFSFFSCSFHLSLSSRHLSSSLAISS